MATNYPTSKDSLTNPTTSDHLDSPSHSAQHANANDAIEALQDMGGYGTTAGVSPYGFIFKNNTAGKLVWKNAASSNSASIYQDSSDDLLFTNPDGDFVFSGGATQSLTIEASTSAGLNVIGDAGNAGIEVRAVGGTAYIDFSNDDSIDYDARLYLAANDNLALRGSDFTVAEGFALKTADGTGTYTTSTYTDSNGHYNILPQSNGKVIVLGRHPRRIGIMGGGESTTYQNAHIQSGWTYTTGVGENQAIAITFPIAFSSDNVRVFLQIIGERATAAGTPDDEGFFTTSTASECAVNSITASGFSGILWSQSGTGIDNMTNYGFSWIAIGPV